MLQVQVVAGTATLSWRPPVDLDRLAAALRSRCAELFDSGIHRVEVSVPVTWTGVPRALHLAGFRREGCRRAAIRDGDKFVDEIGYARLRDDTIDGAEAFSSIMNTVLPRKRVMAHVLFRDPAGQYLFCDTHFKTDWELPGGIVEPFEAPRLGATREVAEELGLEVRLGRLLVVDWLPPWLGWEDALAFVFDGGDLSEEQLANIRPQPSEIAEVHLCTLDHAWDQLTERAQRRFSVATRVLESDAPTQYLEAGCPPDETT